MGATKTITEKDLAHVPTPVLLRAARLRNKAERTKHGRYAAQKKLVKCPGCKKKFGVRELQRHQIVLVVSTDGGPARKRRLCPSDKLVLDVRKN